MNLFIITHNYKHGGCAACSQMALFYISGHMDTGRCSQSQRPLTHQSKTLLYSAAPHHTKVPFLFLSLSRSPRPLFTFLLLFHFPSLSSFTQHKPALLLCLGPILFRLAHFTRSARHSPFFPLSFPATLSPLPSPPTSSIATHILLLFPSKQHGRNQGRIPVLYSKLNKTQPSSQAAVEGGSASSCLCTRWLQVCLLSRCLPRQMKEHASRGASLLKTRTHRTAAAGTLKRQ